MTSRLQTSTGFAHLPQNELNQLASTFNTSIIRSPLPGSGDLSGIIGGMQGTNNALSG
jgi:hypothetical protein